MNIEDLFSADARAFVPSAIRALAPLLNDPTIISFAAGVPNPETFPAEALAAAAAAVLRDLPTRALQYDVTRGYEPLRGKIAARGAAQGLTGGAADVILTTGSQQALDLASRVLLDPHDVVLVEVPTYVGALVTLAARRARPVGVRRDRDGIDLDHLESTVRRLRAEGERVKALYAIPNFQNPSGLAMTRAAKDALAGALARMDLLLLEDDPYGEVSFGTVETLGVDVVPIAARRPEGTLYFGSFSKTLAAGFRTGWMQGPPALLAKMELAKQAADLCSSTFNAAVIDAYLSANDYDAHLSRLRGFYRGRKEVLLGAMAERFPKSISWTDPPGGLFTWVTLPHGADAKALLPKCVASTRTAYVPGESFVVEGDGRRFLRMTFAKESEEKLREGVRRLGEFFHAELA
ncbi:MAG TPA: PLP-dependent aminotransferase family protein [Thermoanaerobaculia bacterium]|nr:PLP-dependent aminotransferase family protein [Thermoanaerobaculia bacterium]